jgi:hypothetical protein
VFIKEKEMISSFFKSSNSDIKREELAFVSLPSKIQHNTTLEIV